jgi:chorismate mutase
MTKNGNDLEQRRAQIDILDSQLLRLLNQRAELASEVASIKRSSGLPVYDGRREQAILDRVCSLNPGPLDAQGLTSIFRCIIRESRKIEESAMQRAQENSFPQENCNGNQHGSKRVGS